MSGATAGKNGTSGLTIKGHFFRRNNILTLGLEVANNSAHNHTDFDLKFKRNPFGVHVENAANKVHIPATGKTSYGTVDCTIDKQNLDGKTPPKNPFLIEIAMKTSVDVFYYSVPCQLHCLLSDQKVSAEDASAFWTKIPPQMEGSFELPKSALYAAFQCSNKASLVEALNTGLSANGFSHFTRGDIIGYAAKTVANNLPVLFNIAAAEDASSIRVVFKSPVPPLKGLIEDAVRYILTRQ